MEFFRIAAVLLLFRLCSAQNNYRVCTNVRTEHCPGVQLGDSRVTCVTAQTTLDCALKLASNQADFAVLSEEEVLLVSQQQPEHHAVLAGIRHSEKINDTWAFEAVAVVRANYAGGLAALRGTGLCHPGYETLDQRWSPKVLRHFEDTVAQTARTCDEHARTPAGSRAVALEQFFGRACRPGAWTPDPTEDALLKSQHPKLCELCQNQNCNEGYGSATDVSSHLLALRCLTDGGTTAVGSGDVAYIAWQKVRSYFQSRSDTSQYALLCEDGSTRQLSSEVISNSTAPCSWLRQPWPAIISTKTAAPALLADLKSWLPAGRANSSSASWVRSLDSILFSDAATRAVFNDSTPSPTDYVTPGRGAQSSETTGCHRPQRWCTISAAETLKCNWIRRAAISLGIEPAVECVQFEDEVACLNNIQMERADFISLDSNYGYLARKRYKLSTVLYHQTNRVNSSRVVSLIKERSTVGEANSTITRFENLRGKTACFPEYGGLAWVSFVRAAHERQVISEQECAYGPAVAEFFGSACAPGADLASHTTTAVPTTLCGACRANPNFPSANSTNVVTANDPASPLIPTVYAQLECSANYSNLYFGTNGTLACIAADHTDVAFVEVQYLSNYFTSLGLNPNNYRVLCRNNSLAGYTGVNVDDACLLAYTVDGEILARRDWEQTLALKSLFYALDDLFGYSSGVNQLVGLKIFAPFDGASDLLFKDSVIGLADTNSTNELARNYEELFKHLDACSAAPATAAPPVSAGRLLLPLFGLVLAPLLARIVN